MTQNRYTGPLAADQGAAFPTGDMMRLNRLRNESSRGHGALRALVVTVLSLVGLPAYAGFPSHDAAYTIAACGDVDCNGSVTASDALRVLRRAVGLIDGLACPADCPPVLRTETTATVSASTTLSVGTTSTLDTFGSTLATPTVTSTSTTMLALTLVESATCGDFDCGGSITAGDALAVLRAAVGLGVDRLNCDCGGPSTTIAAPTTTLPSGTCGDGVRNQSGEQCDGSDDQDCHGLCQFNCTCPPPVCGNDVKESGEVCDGMALGGKTCTTLGFAGGTLGCVRGCAGFDSTECVLSDTPPADPASVAPTLDSTVATDLAEETKFLYMGSPPIQFGVVPGVIKPETIAVIRGKVVTKDGSALAGVAIRIHDHPELGATLSREDGRFDMVVNGGTLLTVDYEKAGRLPAQRQLDVPWRDYVTVPDVVMIAVDAKVSTLALDADAMQVHQGTTVNDEDGPRAATLLIPAGTSAAMKMPDGSTQPLSSLNLRATEFTVGDNGPQAMPGDLPAATGFTYAVEYSVDAAPAAGADKVEFSQPIPTYVENFVGFPVGSQVPAGSYDRKQAKWIPEANGRVIKVLGATGGVADVDVTGDDVADTGTALDEIGMTTAEREKLATLYAAGTELWRVLVGHFSPWDYNWPYGPQDDACRVSQCGQPSPRPRPKDKKDKGPKDCSEKGSIIDCQSQVLGEEIDIAGTPMRLAYRSNRVPGRRYEMDIRLSGLDPLPQSLESILLEVRIGGRLFQQTFAPANDLVESFVWDGKDVYGRTMLGPRPAKVRIGYAYTPQYYATTDSFEASFNRFGSAPVFFARGGGGGGGGAVVFAGVPPRATMPPIVLWEEFDVSLGAWDARAQGLGGWTLDVHHAYHPASGMLWLGDGNRRELKAEAAVIETVADQSLQAYRLDVAPTGDVYVASGAVIWRLRSDGSRERVVGTGQVCQFDTPCGDGGLAVNAQLAGASAIAVAPDGSLYIGDQARIRKIGPDGIIDSIAGNNTFCRSATDECGDGGPASLASMRPVALALAPDGSIYFADYSTFSAERIRRISPDGIVTSVAGNGSGCYPGDPCGDGGPASKAHVANVNSLAVSPDGVLYLSDANLRRVRRIGQDGIIDAFAGTGFQCTQEPCGDGDDARLAQLSYSPRGIALGPDGSLYIADGDLNRIRRVGADGTITTVAGNGLSQTPSGDGGPATTAVIPVPTSVAVAKDGSFYIANVGAVRKVGPVSASLEAGEFFLASEDGSEVYVFNSAGKHQRTLNALTGAARYSFTYNGNGRLVAVTDGDGNQTVVERNASGEATAIVAPGGQRTDLTVNADGFLSSVTNPAGNAVQLGYAGDSAPGLLTSFTDSRSVVHQFTYDADGRLITDFSPGEGTITLTRTTTGEDSYEVAFKSAAGFTTVYGVEDLPNGETRRVRTEPSGAATEVLVRTDGSERIAHPDGTVVDVKRGPDPRFGMHAPVPTEVVITLPGRAPAVRTASRAATVSDPDDPMSLLTQIETVSVNGQIYTTTFDATALEATYTRPSGRQSVYHVDEQGRPLQYEPAGGSAPLTWSWDAAGRLTKQQQAGQAWTFAYGDAANPFRVTSRTDALGRTIAFEYDAANRITKTILPGSEELEFTYDANGNRTHLVLPGGADHELQYAPSDDEVGYLPPGNPGAYTRQLDGDRRVTGVTLPSGTQQSWTYDAFGRLLQIGSADATTSLAYAAGDPTRRFETMTRIASTVTQDLGFEYAGDLLTELSFGTTAVGNYTYEYDPSFRLTARNLSSGADDAPYALSYDSDGLLTAFGGFTVSREVASALPTKLADGTAEHDLTFDAVLRLQSRAWAVNGTPVYAEQVTYDAVGRVAQRIETVNGAAATYAYTYDVNGCLIAVTRNGVAVEEYGYDGRGNRTSRTRNGGATETSTYDLQDRLQARQGTAYSFDADGFLAQRGADTFDFGARGEILGAVVDGQSVTYGYDGYGRRTSRSTAAGTSQYLYGNPQHQLQMTASRDTAGVLTTYFYDEGGRLIAFERSGARYYVAGDMLGTPKAVVDANGTVVKTMSWDAFGNLVSDSNAGFALEIGFAGGLRDPLTGLTRFGVRDYEPASGRWTSRDSALFATRQTNLYAYVANDPVNKIDPVGLFSFGASAYDGLGGGIKLAITGEGISFCAEVGIGGGDNIEFDPSGGLDKDGVSLDAAVALKAGPLGGFEVGSSLKGECQLETKAKGCLGPLCTEGTYKDGQWQPRTGKAETSPGDFKALATKSLAEAAKLKLEGKVVANFCAAGKW